jgi:hypothetical protein
LPSASAPRGPGIKNTSEKANTVAGRSTENGSKILFVFKEK